MARSLLFVRYGLHTAFHRLANHRGVWHTWIAGLASAFATVLIFYYVFDRPDGVAWLAGGFLFVGFLTHLILDEIYSVDVLGNHIKRSFGTAFKPIDWRNPVGSALMAAAAVALLFATHPSAPSMMASRRVPCGRRSTPGSCRTMPGSLALRIAARLQPAPPRQRRRRSPAPCRRQPMRRPQRKRQLPRHRKPSTMQQRLLLLDALQSSEIVEDEIIDQGAPGMRP
ncbi:MAG: hypothetical protein WDN31_20735 [Hyphomicrobium sp.]